jgi:integrase
MTDNKLTETIEYGQDLAKILPEENLDKLCSRFKRNNYRFATRLLFRGGLRTSEAISNLKWEDLERKENGLEVKVEGWTTRTVVLKDEKILNLYEELQEESGEIFEVRPEEYRRKLCCASRKELQPHDLRRSRVYQLVFKEKASANRLRNELGFSLPAAEQRTKEVKK